MEITTTQCIWYKWSLHMRISATLLLCGAIGIAIAHKKEKEKAEKLAFVSIYHNNYSATMPCASLKHLLS